MRAVVEQRRREMQQQLDKVNAEIVQLTANANALFGAIQFADQLLTAEPVTEEAPKAD